MTECAGKKLNTICIQLSKTLKKLTRHYITLLVTIEIPSAALLSARIFKGCDLFFPAPCSQFCPTSCDFTFPNVLGEGEGQKGL